MFSLGIIAENFEVFENDIFDFKVLWMAGEGEWNSVGFFVLGCGLNGHGGLRSVTFVVRSLGRFLGCDVCLGLQQSQGSRIF